MRVADLFIEAKNELDGIFGEGFAVANPVLVDRYVQQAFRSRGKAIGHHKTPLDTSYAYDFVSTFARGLREGKLTKSLSFSEQIDCSILADAVATDLGVSDTPGFKASLGRFIKGSMGVVKRKRTVGKERSWYYHFPDFETVKQYFNDATGALSTKE